MVERLEDYRGWEIRWTGLKSRKSVYPAYGRTESPCPKCDQPIKDGDDVLAYANTEEVTHWACSGKAGPPDYLVGQLLGWFFVGYGPHKRLWKCFYANVGTRAILPNTPKEKVEKLKSSRLAKLKEMIDKEESAPCGFWGEAPSIEAISA